MLHLLFYGLYSGIQVVEISLYDVICVAVCARPQDNFLAKVAIIAERFKGVSWGGLGRHTQRYWAPHYDPHSG